jgi:hypothetical protein
MSTRNAVLIYTTGASQDTVVIDYDRTMELFLTGGERVPFSAERLVRMLDWRAQSQRLSPTLVGCLQVIVSGARCELTQCAVGALAGLYRLRLDWQVEYPHLAPVFAQVSGEVAAP